MRKLIWGNSQILLPECIGQVERTWGTETSKYPQEKKKTLIPSVAASESGDSPNQGSPWGCGRLEELQNLAERNCLESQTIEGESPVCEKRRSPLRGVPE